MGFVAKGMGIKTKPGQLGALNGDYVYGQFFEQ